MSISLEEVYEYIKIRKTKVGKERWWEFRFESPVIEFEIDDRPKVTIHENNAGDFLLDYWYRNQFLESIGVPIDTHTALKEMVQLLNGEIGVITTYHFSYAPIQIKDSSISFINGQYLIVSIGEEQFIRFGEVFSSIKGLIDGNGLSNGVILFSKEKASIVSAKQTNNQFHDRLNDIYSKHSIVFGLLCFYWGNFGLKVSTVSSDNFPNASASGAAKLRMMELRKIDESNRQLLEVVLKKLHELLFYRMIICSELGSSGVFDSAIFLRCLLDPFLERSRNKVSEIKEELSLDKKTEAQAHLVFQFLENNGVNIASEISITEGEFTDFLGIRNSIIHPKPSDGIERLHLLYDKLLEIRKVVYLFVTLCIHNNVKKDFDSFEIEL